MKHKCKDCKRTAVPILKFGGGVCRNCRIILFLPGSEEYAELLDINKKKVKRPGFEK